MVKRLNDLVVKVGEYTNSKGEKKTQYHNVGAELQGDDGSTYLLIDRYFNPAGVPDFNGKGSARIAVWKFPPREQNNSASAPEPTQSRSAPSRGGDIRPDDIPF